MRLIDANTFAQRAYEVSYPVVHGHNDRERGLTLFGIAQLLDEQPIIEMPRWMPVTEKLPKENGVYLCTTKDAYMKFAEVEVLWLDRGKWVYYHDEFGDVERDDVTAWMPLPEPYKEDEE